MFIETCEETFQTIFGFEVGMDLKGCDVDICVQCTQSNRMSGTSSNSSCISTANPSKSNSTVLPKIRNFCTNLWYRSRNGRSAAVSTQNQAEGYLDSKRIHRLAHNTNTYVVCCTCDGNSQSREVIHTLKSKPYSRLKGSGVALITDV